MLSLGSTLWFIVFLLPMATQWMANYVVFSSFPQWVCFWISSILLSILFLLISTPMMAIHAVFSCLAQWVCFSLGSTLRFIAFLLPMEGNSCCVLILSTMGMFQNFIHHIVHTLPSCIYSNDGNPCCVLMISTMGMLLTRVHPRVHSSYSLLSPWLLQWWQIMMRFPCFSIVDFLLNWVHPMIILHFHLSKFIIPKLSPTSAPVSLVFFFCLEIYSIHSKMEACF